LVKDSHRINQGRTLKVEYQTLPVDKIRPSAFQPRETFPKKEIEELAESIKMSGLVQPILVRKKGETYEIIAGERRWRAAQFAGLKEMPVLITKVDDIEAKELSLIENWHRLALQTVEAERFIAGLYENGTKAGWYKSLTDMAKKLGINQTTLFEIVSAHNEREELELSPVITYTDIRETKLIRDQPDLRKRILKLREEGKLSRDELRDFSKTAIEVSEPVKEALLELRIKPEEARIIETELTSPHEKIEAVKTIEMERRPERVVSLVRFIKEMEDMKKEIELVKEIDTGDIWLCPVCNKKFHLIHAKPSDTHRFEEVIE
jgi:ParB/RepB/Spo0J family partition protein